jgi:hypothetical protein
MVRVARPFAITLGTNGISRPCYSLCQQQLLKYIAGLYAARFWRQVRNSSAFHLGNPFVLIIVQALFFFKLNDQFPKKHAFFSYISKVRF